jgi:hypothetical protein
MTARFEARAATAVGAVLGGVGVASSVSPSIDGFLSCWAAYAVIGGGAAGCLYVVARSAWLSLMIEWELRRRIRPDEIPPEVRARLAERREREEARDA